MVTRRHACAALLGAGWAPAGVRRDAVHLDRTRQVIENFSASDCWRAQKLGGWSPAHRDRLADLLFSQTKGIGLSCWRFNIGGGINPRITQPWRTVESFEVSPGQYDWSRQANERWFLQAAKARGVPQFLAFVVSPPGSMTRNGLTFCDKGSHTTNLGEGGERAFAEYVADVLQHLRDEGERVDFDYISPLNEPQWDWEGHTQEGTRASNADIKRMTRELYRELRGRGLRAEIALLESGNIPDMAAPNEKMTKRFGTLFGNYLEDLIGDPETAATMGRRITYHSYWSDRLDTQLVQHRRTFADALRKYPGWKVWQTEYCVMDGPEGKGGPKRDLTMDTALDVARVIHLDLTLVGASAWQWWTAFSEADYKDGLIYTDWKKPGDAESIIESKLLWVLGNYSRYVRPGMKRVEIDGDGHDLRGVLGSAYLDERSRRVALVYLNLSREPVGVQPELLSGSKRVNVSAARAFVTSDKRGDDLREVAIAPALRTELPARSALTITAELRESE